MDQVMDIIKLKKFNFLMKSCGIRTTKQKFGL